MTLIDRLKQYNAWRREDGPDRPEMPDPTQIGKDIDEAIARLSAALGDGPEKTRSKMMSEVQRYDIEETGRGYMTYREMVEASDGDYVRYDDVAAKLAELEAKLARLPHTADGVLDGVEHNGMPDHFPDPTKMVDPRPCTCGAKHCGRKCLCNASEAEVHG